MNEITSAEQSQLHNIRAYPNREYNIYKRRSRKEVDMSLSKASQSWRMPDELWEKIKPLLPPRKSHPFGCHRPLLDDRKAMDAIFYRLRTGCQWKALDATGICSSSSAHRRFQEWTQAGVFRTLWAQGLLDYDALKGLDWEWQAMDGAMTKAPLGQEQWLMILFGEPLVR